MSEFEKLMDTLKDTADEAKSNRLICELYSKVQTMAQRDDLTEGDVVCMVAKTLALVNSVSRPCRGTKRQGLEVLIGLVRAYHEELTGEK